MDTAQSLKDSGLKATAPRRRILELFEASKVRHLSAEDVYKALLGEGMDVGLATVYRVLTQFEHAGLLSRQHFETGKAVYELNQGGHHDHLVCLQCGRVEEFYDPEIERLRAPRPLARALRRLHQEGLPLPGALTQSASSSSAACLRAVDSAPPSMRASSATRAARSSRTTRTEIRPLVESLSTE
jgi:Fur family ferric uptake transcriptional regulator